VKKVKILNEVFILRFLVLFVPFVSVSITAHDWREYLLEAVDSASNQTLPKEEYQIIVVKT
jgi:hypothetical protein